MFSLQNLTEKHENLICVINMLTASIIIPTYNSAGQLERALQSILDGNFDSHQYEIIIVDNGSNDKTAIVVNNFIKQNDSHKIRYIYDDVPGLLTGRHRGAKESLSDILVFVDQDIYADKNWLSSIVEAFNRFPDVQLIGGKCLPKYETEPPAWLNYFWQSSPDEGKFLGSLSLCDFGDQEKEISPLWIWGLNFSIRKKTLYDLGGFHPDCISPQYQQFQGDGEGGLSLKAIAKGYKALYQPNALVYHEVTSKRMSWAYFEQRYFYQGICNSYSEIRQNNGIKKMVVSKRLNKFIIKLLHNIYLMIFPKPVELVNDEINREKEMLFARFNAMERAGFNFHQEMAKKNPIVMKWVLRETYWDYSIPGFKLEENL